MVSIIITTLVCESVRLLIYKSYRWFPHRFRLLKISAIGTLWCAFLLSLSFFIRWNFNLGIVHEGASLSASFTVNGRAISLGLIGYSLINGLINFAILALGYEIIYRQAQFRFADKQREKLEKDKLKAELNQLKGIVNPHFLFNNLNSLSALIGEDPDKAQQFLDELTQVFRYLLRNNQTELTTLEEELRFIQTYYQLLRTRYGPGIELTIHTDSSYNKLLIPPLTLQLLVENAVKHNRIQKDRPLVIEMLPTSDQRLIVRNNIAPKENTVESTGIGLQTIDARYKMLNRSGIQIERSETHYGAIITLIANHEV